MKLALGLLRSSGVLITLSMIVSCKGIVGSDSQNFVLGSCNYLQGTSNEFCHEVSYDATSRGLDHSSLANEIHMACLRARGTFSEATCNRSASIGSCSSQTEASRVAIKNERVFIGSNWNSETAERHCRRLSSTTGQSYSSFVAH